VVKWFDPVRGLGVIAPDGNGFDAVAYRSAFRGIAEQELVAGRRVRFDLTVDATGVRADNICPTPPLRSGPVEEAEEDTGAPTPGWTVEVPPEAEEPADCPWCVQLLETGDDDRRLPDQADRPPEPAALTRGAASMTAWPAAVMLLTLVTLAVIGRWVAG
jgi:CspA family cold shock protein